MSKTIKKISGRAIIIRYGEIFLKGKNKSYFENALIKNLKHALKNFEHNIYKISARIIVNNYDINLEKNILNVVKNVFGVYSVSPSFVVETSLNNIIEKVEGIKILTNTFRIEANRADKKFELNSMDLARKLGGVVLKLQPELKVNLTKPETTISIDIRENGETFIFSETIKALGGMPVGTAGKAMLLLSGGIDSPVAGFQLAKRGLELEAIHYHSFPYTSELAKQKVITLAKLLSVYTGKIKLYVVPFTKIQEEIRKHTSAEYSITLMRRFMTRIAEQVALKAGSQALITGESLGQVASQTIESLTSTNSVVKQLPILRPLISFDKEEIIEISKKINTFETSILPYEDCCTVFIPEKPIIKPKLERVLQQEENLNIENLIEDAIENIETIIVEN